MPVVEMFCIGGVPVKKGISAGPALEHFYMIHRVGRTQCLGAFSRWIVESKARALGAARNVPDPLGIFVACPRVGTGEGGANATGPGAACGQA